MSMPDARGSSAADHASTTRLHLPARQRGDVPRAVLPKEAAELPRHKHRSQAMTRAELLALADLAERVKGADRELDAGIYAGIHDCTLTRWVFDNAPAFTASLDAAASLVPEGWTVWELRQNAESWWCQLEPNSNAPMVCAEAVTEPLARTAAALRARAEELP
jgi:hypothetical protein